LERKPITSGLDKKEFEAFLDTLDILRNLDEVSRRRVLKIINQVV
jgi:hypothetical protein